MVAIMSTKNWGSITTKFYVESKQREKRGRRGRGGKERREGRWRNLELFISKIHNNTQVLQELRGTHHVGVADAAIDNCERFEFVPRKRRLARLFDSLINKLAGERREGRGRGRRGLEGENRMWVHNIPWFSLARPCRFVGFLHPYLTRSKKIRGEGERGKGEEKKDTRLLKC
jgi:hypothetical protein